MNLFYMYCYFYDSFLSQDKYGRVIASLETQLAELGVNGKAIKLSILKNLKELIEDEIKQGCQTVVVIGGESIFNQAVNILAHYPKVTLGFIPLGEKSSIASFFGLPLGLEACSVIANRLISRIDLGQIWDYYFLQQVQLPSQGIEVECDGQYHVRFPVESGSISIYNSGCYQDRRGQRIFKPSDGFLNLVIPGVKKSIFSSSSKNTILRARKIKLRNIDQTVSLRIDEKHVVNLPVEITVAKQRLSLIVGKERKY